MAWIDVLLGRPLASRDENVEQLGTFSGVPIFGLDALGSAAYGPEAALTILLPLGLAGTHYIWPISIAIIILLGIVYFSYRADDSGVPKWRRLLYRSDSKSGYWSRTTGRPGATHRLRTCRRGWYCSRNRCTGLRSNCGVHSRVRTRAPES